MTADDIGPLRRFPLIPDDSGEVSALVSVVRRLCVAKSVAEVMETVVHPARALLGAGGVTFVLRDGDFCHYAEEDAISPLWKGKRFPLDACISGWCMKEARPAVIPDIYQDPRIPHDAYRPTFVRSLAMVPVPVDQPIAAMGAYWPNIRTISAGEVDLLQTIGNAAALALSNVAHRREKDRQARDRDELAHRIKNVFAVVMALSNMTDASTVPEFREALNGRLSALKAAHAELLDRETGTVELSELVNRLLLPLVKGETVRLALDGPKVLLPERIAAGMALVVQELATNSVKYGSLSAAAGRVSVSWARDGDRLHLSWEESDGPPVRPPTRAGFGTRLIKVVTARQLRGEADLRYEPDGFRATLTATLAD